MTNYFFFACLFVANFCFAQNYDKPNTKYFPPTSLSKRVIFLLLALVDQININTSNFGCEYFSFMLSVFVLIHLYYGKTFNLDIKTKTKQRRQHPNSPSCFIANRAIETNSVTHATQPNFRHFVFVLSDLLYIIIIFFCFAVRFEKGGRGKLATLVTKTGFVRPANPKRKVFCYK